MRRRQDVRTSGIGGCDRGRFSTAALLNLEGLARVRNGETLRHISTEVVFHLRRRNKSPPVTLSTGRWGRLWVCGEHALIDSP